MGPALGVGVAATGGTGVGAVVLVGRTVAATACGIGVLVGAGLAVAAGGADVRVGSFGPLQAMATNNAATPPWRAASVRMADQNFRVSYLMQALAFSTPTARCANTGMHPKAP